MTKQLVLIGGESAAGKSASLKDIPNQERWLYLNTESGKALPFKNKFLAKVITDPYQVFEGFDYITGNPNFDGVIIDSITFLMDMFESQYIIGTKNGQEAWSQYAQYFKNLMQKYVAGTDKHVVMLAHTRSEQDAMLIDRVSVPVKGSLKNNGIEAYFSTVVAAKRMPLTELQGFDPNLLHITPEDEALGFKYVFQTRLTKNTIGERIRGPMGLFESNQSFMDNNVGLLLDHMIKYYT